MIIKVNYDLLEKINESEKGIKISKSMKSLTAGSVIGITIFSPFLYSAFDNFLLGISNLILIVICCFKYYIECNFYFWSSGHACHGDYRCGTGNRICKNI